jgi:hypothetical protein
MEMMYDRKEKIMLGLTNEQKVLGKSITNFAEKEIAPLAYEIDRNSVSVVTRKMVRDMNWSEEK